MSALTFRRQTQPCGDANEGEKHCRGPACPPSFRVGIDAVRCQLDVLSKQLEHLAAEQELELDSFAFHMAQKNEALKFENARLREQRTFASCEKPNAPVCKFDIEGTSPIIPSIMGAANAISSQGRGWSGERACDSRSPNSRTSAVADHGDLWPFFRCEGSGVVHTYDAKLSPVVATMMAQMVPVSSNVSTSESDAVHRSCFCSCLCLLRAWQLLLVPQSSWHNFVWEVVGGLVICFDVVMMPMSVFALPENGVLDAKRWFSAVYWSLDILHQLFVYDRDNIVQWMKPWLAARRYITTWFAPDVMVVCLDWLFIVAMRSGQAASRSWRMSKVIRSLRFLRAVRLVRLLKVLDLATRAMKKVRTHDQQLALKSVYAFVAFVLCIHYIGCYWYGVASISDDLVLRWAHFGPSTTWVQEHSLEGASTSYLYVVAYQWSLAQFGLTSSCIYATNGVENVFAIGVACFVWVTMFAVLGGVTVNALQYHVRRAEDEQQVGRIQAYLQDRHISATLACDVMRFVYDQRSCKKACASACGISSICETDAQLLDNIPAGLLVAMRKEMYLPSLKHAQVFSMFDDVMLGSFCNLAVEEHLIPPGGVVFEVDTDADRMLIVSSGDLKYWLSMETSPTLAQEGQCFCEAALWMQWCHAGCLVTVTSCDLIGVVASRFRCILAEAQRRGADLTAIRCYARCAASYYAQLEPHTDLSAGDDELPPELAECLRTAAIEKSSPSPPLRRRVLTSLISAYRHSSTYVS
mmetsp:Transcript_65914/g.183627  ORF Transcript_65914/g.183627 Transcript_65914/m.183627 type:complete len:751 (+) Transcript_65914:116-2368(+)